MNPATFDEKTKTWTQTIAYRPYYKVIEAGIILNENTTQIYQKIRRGTLPAYKVQGTLAISHDDLVAYIERQKSQQSPEISPYIIGKLEELNDL